MGSGPGGCQQVPRGRARQPEAVLRGLQGELALYLGAIITGPSALPGKGKWGDLIGGAQPASAGAGSLGLLPNIEPVGGAPGAQPGRPGLGRMGTASSSWRPDGKGSLGWDTEVCGVLGALCPGPVCFGTTPGLVGMGLWVQGRGRHSAVAWGGVAGGVAGVGADHPPHCVCRGLGHVHAV